KDTELRLGLPG
nr:Chain E, Auxin-responsive protein IAA1 [Arabidopsis thaliana]5C7F_F Chain F, Auxin-responsive protein IAA1 [Arabidopsis thaliana]5C7F_G Chain G, Auxin-responsive protein IAA1 [Arabidopsis thaliana]5C7F_H Chain H, Auxin-responsive protein IAA1 [Arabidopsis thaliana]